MCLIFANGIFILTHTFDTFDEVLDANLFNGRSIRERLDEILVYDRA